MSEHTPAADEQATLEDIANELRLIRKTLRRSRVHTLLVGLLVVVLASIGVWVFIDDNNDDRRETENLAFILRTRCERRNDERVEDAEVLASVLAPEPTPEMQERIDLYFQRLEETENDCDVEARDLLP